MKGFVFGPSRLHRSVRQQERDGYAFTAELLRDFLGDDPLAEARRRAQRDLMLRAMFRAAAADLALAVLELEQRASREDGK